MSAQTPGIADTLLTAEKPTSKREQLPFVPHKKTPWLVRRGKPNPEAKANGSPGDPIPFGSWYVSKTVDGKFYRFSLATEVYAEALTKYDEWYANRKTTVPSEGNLASLHDEFILRRKGKRKDMRSLEERFRRLVDWCPFMCAPYRKLTNIVILEQWNALSEPATRTTPDGTIVTRDLYKPNTLKEDLWVLKSLIKIAVNHQFISRNHDLLMDVEVEDPDNKCPDSVVNLTHDMFITIRLEMYNGDCGRHPHTPIVFDVYWMSGGRKSSVANIYTEDVNFETGWLTFRVAKYWPNGYKIPMSADLQILLKEHISKYNKKPGEKIFDVVHINKTISTACMKVGWVHMHAHDFRHLFAVHAMERGCSLSQIAAWLGHKDGGLLAGKLYGYIRNEESQRAMQRNMTFVATQWSPEGLQLIRKNIRSKLNDLSEQIAAAPSQSHIETLLLEVKGIAEKPIAATNTNSARVLAQVSVRPNQLRQELLKEVIDWIHVTPSLPCRWLPEILAWKFPGLPIAVSREAMNRTVEIRKVARKTAHAELHAKMVDYLKSNPDRYVSWLLYDFPEATEVQARRAVLAARGTFNNDLGKRDLSCPVTYTKLIARRQDTRLAYIKQQLSKPTSSSGGNSPDGLGKSASLAESELGYFQGGS